MTVLDLTPPWWMFGLWFLNWIIALYGVAIASDTLRHARAMPPLENAPFVALFFVLNAFEPIIALTIFALGFLAGSWDSGVIGSSAIGCFLATIPLSGLLFPDHAHRLFSLQAAGLMWSRWLVNLSPYIALALRLDSELFLGMPLFGAPAVLMTTLLLGRWRFSMLLKYEAQCGRI
ncbi:MAG: hypothetical protein RMK99_08910 [Anaerolineales bacterium]|nr:hypothetical protein [Anaerolineales bacterium]